MNKDYYNQIKEEFLIEDINSYKFGSIDDGGYFINPKTILEADILFSGGISSNVEFEYDLFRFNSAIKIIMVDPTVSPLRLISKGILRSLLLKKNKLRYLSNTLVFIHMIRSGRSWHIKKWLSDKNKIFDIISEKIKLEKNSKIILKLDIEGSEYDLLEEIEKNLDLFNCLIFEFHDLNDKHEMVYNFLKKCNDKFNLVCLEINPSGGFDKQNRPKNIEVTLERNGI
jgi:hypothetical protein